MFLASRALLESNGEGLHGGDLKEVYQIFLRGEKISFNRSRKS